MHGLGLGSFLCALALLAWPASSLAFDRPDRPYPAPDAVAHDDVALAAFFVEKEETESLSVYPATVICSYPHPDAGYVSVYGRMIGPDAQISTPTKLKVEQSTNLLMQVIYASHTLVFRVADVVVPFRAGALSLTDKDGNLSFHDDADVAISKLSCKGDLATAMAAPAIAARPGVQLASFGTSPFATGEVVHNIEVDGTHNYFVGSSEVLVHNE
ncbi:MAG TPA: hypothetical protein VEL28_13545 [Candidatus Binatia bacterium]|nr:hypothetical protein [Candidatus Binatia bacterium]